MQCMTSAKTLHVKVLLRRSEFSLLCVSIYIHHYSPPLLGIVA